MSLFRILKLLVIIFITSMSTLPLAAMEDISADELALLNQLLNGKQYEMKVDQHFAVPRSLVHRTTSQKTGLDNLFNAIERSTTDETIAQALKEHDLSKAIMTLKRASDIQASSYKLLMLLMKSRQPELLKKLLLTKEHYCLVYQTVQQMVAKNDYASIQQLKNHGLSGDWYDESKTPSLLDTAYMRYKQAANKSDYVPMLRCIISTPASLQSFVEANDYEAVSLFMSLGASPLQTTKQGTTLIECAQRHYLYEMAGLLASHKKT